MDQTLKPAPGGGIQGQTISQGNLAQPAPVGDPGGTPIGQVQPGATGTSLGPQNGIALNNTVLPNVKLNLAPSVAASSKPVATAAKPHHTSAILFILPLLLVLVAAAIVWQAKRDAKSTTDY